MSLAPQSFVLFLAAVLVLLITPGPNMAFVLTSGAAYGWQGGLAAALGIGVVDLVFTLASALGIAGLMAAYPAAFVAVRWAGAAYLLYLAIAVLGTAGRHGSDNVSVTDPSRSAIFLRGLASNIANPKAILFFLVFIPQFVDAGPHQSSGAVVAQFILLGCTLAVVGVLFHGSLGALGAAGATLAGRSAKARRGLQYLQAAVFLLIAARLVL